MKHMHMNSENTGVWALVAFTLMAAVAGYVISGQPAIVLVLLMGMFPIVMSLAMRKRNR